MTPKKKLSEIVKDMAGLKQQWAAAGKPLPSGEYLCDLLSGEVFQAQTGTLGFKVTLRVKSGDSAGRLVWHDFYLSPAALPRTLKALAQIGITDPEQLDDGLPQGLVVKAQIVVNKRDNGDERNEIRSWELAAVSEDGGAPPAQSDAPATATPWSVDLSTLDADKTKGDGQ